MSKRWAIWYHNNFGRNDGPPLYYWNVLKNKLDMDVEHLFPEGDTRRFGEFDYHLWIDYGEDGLPVDRSWKLPKKGTKIYVISDAHIDDAGKQYRFDKADTFDYVFFNQLEAMEEYVTSEKHGSREGTKVHFLPHAAEPEAYPRFTIAKKYDIGFIGHMQDVENYNGITRLNFLDRMFREFPNFYFGTRHSSYPERNMFEDASKRFGETRVVLNISIKDDLNMRFFEVLSSGSFLLTNWIPNPIVSENDGKYFATYKTMEEAIDKTKYYLEHEDEREEIAKSGYEWFMNNHTYEHRFKEILEVINYKE